MTFEGTKLERVEFRYARPIGPPIGVDWPGKRTSPLYWLVRKTVELSEVPDSVEVLIAADRHYELFVNGRLAVRQRGFFSGDHYVFAQRWDEEVRALLRPGANTIDVVIRSDPWRNKNYRYFRPMLMLEAERIGLFTDASWETAVIEGWREQIGKGAAGTIHFERVTLPQTDSAALSGFHKNLVLSSASELEVGEGLPVLYLWNDPPKRIDTHAPEGPVASGACELGGEALSFAVETILGMWRSGTPVVLAAEFDDPGGQCVRFAASTLVRYKMDLNGALVAEQTEVPNRHQMGLPGYLLPAGRAVTKPGRNTLRISLPGQQWRPGEFRIAAKGAPAIMAPACWNIEPQKAALELPDRIGCKWMVEGGRPIEFKREDSAVRIDCCGGQRMSVVLDMGGVTTGYVSMKITAASAGRIYLAHGFFHREGAVDCNRMLLRAVDILDVPAGESAYRAFDVRTFRLLDLVFEGFEGQVEVQEIRVVEPVFLDETASSFESSDKLVNAVWQASRRTAQLCCTEVCVDNPDREHGQWVDCATATLAAAYYAFGEARRPAKVWQEVSWAQQPDGQLPGYAPGRWFPRRPLQCHMALFVNACHRHYMHTGDEVFGRQMLEVILRMIEHWERHRTLDGMIADLHTVFVDWGSHFYSYARGGKGPTGALTAMNAYYLGVLKLAAEMAGFLGQDATSARLREMHSDLCVSMRQHLYDARVGLFRDGAGNPEAEGNFSQTANALAVLYGAAPEGQEQVTLKRAFEPPDDVEVIPASAHFARQAGEALFEARCDELALRWLRDGFGKMLETGHGTFWETWEPFASLCQATGSAPAYLFSRYLAGIYPAEPGYRVIGIDPHPSGLENLQARLATPVGCIAVGWLLSDDRLQYRLGLPGDLQGRPVVKPDYVELLMA